MFKKAVPKAVTLKMSVEEFYAIYNAVFGQVATTTNDALRTVAEKIRQADVELEAGVEPARLGDSRI